MKNKMVEITWARSGFQIPQYGLAIKGKQTQVPQDVADSLIEQGLAKLSKKSKITKSEKVSDTGEE
jgi:hypothetical protein|tara:strand:- start:350 stop:547 length:198 start_codon:yes stop_codon:yes gene_type:complete